MSRSNNRLLIAEATKEAQPWEILDFGPRYPGVAHHIVPYFFKTGINENQYSLKIILTKVLRY
jgi:hypothetical protein